MVDQSAALRLSRSLSAWSVVILGALVFQAPSVLFNVGLPVKDFLVHYRWAVEFSDALSGGDYYPRWMARAYFGLGEPALLYYSPLFFFCTAIIRCITGNTWAAMRLVFFISTVITGHYGYRILKGRSSEGFALFGAICLEMTPMIQMLFNYVSEIPWAVSFAALVALIYCATRPGAFEKIIDLPVSVCVALLVMTHILAAFMLLICFSGYFLTHIRFGKGQWAIGKAAISWAASVTFGLLLSSVYLVPALTSMHYISSGVWTQNYTPWSAFSFPTITTIVYGMRWFSFQWIVSGVVLLSVAVTTWFAVRRPQKADGAASLLFFLLTASWIALFLASELSFPLWAAPTPLRMLQFPHRFIYIASATGALANLIVLWERLQRWPAEKSKCALAALPLLLAIALSGALEAKFILIDARPLKLAPDDRSPYPGLAEYLPSDAGAGKKADEKEGYVADCWRQGLVCGPATGSGDRMSFQISTPAQKLFRLPVFGFPTWSATVNGAPAVLHTDPGTGTLSLSLPKGRDTVLLVWQRLPQELIGVWLSLVSVGAAIFLTSRRGRALLQF